MELTLTTFFGLSEEHATKIMALDVDVRTKKIEELRAWRECSKITF
ncbi:phage protein [Streptococcus pyogenes]|nr:phage protein [Streptococcus pyogenes]